MFVILTQNRSIIQIWFFPSTYDSLRDEIEKWHDRDKHQRIIFIYIKI